jgi:hypothetical protein
MKNSRKIITDILEELNVNSFIEMQKDYVGVPVDELLYSMITKHHKVNLSKKLSDFYHSMSGCRIEWSCDLNKYQNIKKYNADDTIITGEIYIKPVEEMLDFEKKLEADWWIKNLSEEERNDLHNFRSFDFNDDYTRVGFIIEDNALHDNKMVFITQESSGFSPTGLSFDQYLEKIFQYKGFQGWQYNYFFQNTNNYKRMMFYLDQLF